MSYLNHLIKRFDLAKNWRSYQLSLIKKYINNKILEIGPGGGEIIENFVNDKNQITLIDNDSELCGVLNEKFKNNKNVTIVNSNIKFTNEKYDTILYMDVIEHIEKDIDELDLACDRLTNDGKLVIVVPAFNFLFSSYDKDVGHYRRYEKKDFKNYVKNKNLNILSLKYFDSLGFFILILVKLFKFKGKNSTVLGIKLWNLMVPISRLIDKLFFHQFGKSLMCVIEKKS